MSIFLGSLAAMAIFAGGFVAGAIVVVYLDSGGEKPDGCSLGCAVAVIAPISFLAAVYLVAR